MKKIISLFLAFFCIVTLFACHSKSDKWQEQYDLGVRYLSENNYEEAVIAFTAAIEIDGKRAPAYAGRGDVYVVLGKYEEAVSDYRAAIDRSLKEPKYYKKLADVYLLLNDTEAAEEVLQEGFDATGDSSLQELAEKVKTAGVLSGRVSSWEDESIIAQATVEIKNIESEASERGLVFLTDDSGKFSTLVFPGKYTVSVKAAGYQTETLERTVEENGNVYDQIYLLSTSDTGTGKLSGRVVDRDGMSPIVGAEIWAVSASESSETAHVITSDEGNFEISNVPVGRYDLFATCEGFEESSIVCYSSNKKDHQWTVFLNANHEHQWGEATYTKPSTCSECGRTKGGLLLPTMQSYSFIDIGETRSVSGEYYTKTEGEGKCEFDVTVTNYYTINSDNEHEAKDGYEWRIATFDVSGKRFQFSPLIPGQYDYYSGSYLAYKMNYLDELTMQAMEKGPSNGEMFTIEVDDPTYNLWKDPDYLLNRAEHILDNEYSGVKYSFLVNDYYEEATECTGMYTVEYGPMSNDAQHVTVVFSALVPVGYDGVVCGIGGRQDYGASTRVFFHMN